MNIVNFLLVNTWIALGGNIDRKGIIKKEDILLILR